MATPAFVSFIMNEDTSLQSVKNDSSLVISFKHAVFFKEMEVFTNNPIREHHPFVFAKEIDKSSVSLYKYMTRGTIIDSVTIDWFQFNEKTKKNEIYMQHILERVKISSIALSMPNIRNMQFERNVHLEEISLRYDKITWFCPNGYIRFTDQWNFSLFIHSMKQSEKEEMHKLLQKDALTDDFADWFEERKIQKKIAPKKNIKILFQAKDGSALKGVSIKIATGESFVSDESGNISIDNYSGASDTVEIVSIELAS
jgi:type VI secretion system Hcp family effector